MQELINKLEFMKAEFQKRQDAEIIGSIEFYHYFGIVQGYQFSINEIKQFIL